MASVLGAFPHLFVSTTSLMVTQSVFILYVHYNEL